MARLALAAWSRDSPELRLFSFVTGQEGGIHFLSKWVGLAEPSPQQLVLRRVKLLVSG